MKKTILMLIIAGSAKISAQTEQWTTDLLNVPEGMEANLGTSSDKPLNIFTNNSKRVVVDHDGNLRVVKLQGDDYRLVWADSEGNLGTMNDRMLPQNAVPSTPCISGAFPWFEGGNTIGSYGVSSLGTCNNKDLQLMAYNKKSIFITAQDGYVGVGPNNSTPMTTLDVFDPSGNNTNHLLFHGDQSGSIETLQDMTMVCNGNFLFYNAGGTSRQFAIDGNGRSIFGYQTSEVDAAKVNVNVNANSATPINAFDIFDQYTNKVNFRVKSNGVVYAREVNVQYTNFPDYVFKKNYSLMPLDKLESFIQKNHHLPNVPSAAEIEKDGGNLAELSRIQMEKIEELTLYVIQLKKEIDSLKKKID